MRIHESFRQCVAFLVSGIWQETVTRINPLGTVFLVGMGLEDVYDPMRPFCVYAVTARHNITHFDDHTVLNIVLNKVGGGYAPIHTVKADWRWLEHTDVAVCEILDSDKPELSGWSFPFDWFVDTKDSLGVDSLIRLGDPVFTAGFYEGFCGRNSVQPIARFGDIALMPNPEEKIETYLDLVDKDDRGKWKAIDAYLVEMNVWEGQSGSPVLVPLGDVSRPKTHVHVTGLPDNQLLVEKETAFRPAPRCIGLVQGYYSDSDSDINTGIAIVIPSYEILKLLRENEDLKRSREYKLSQTPASRVIPRLA